ncbi:hypothetical protein REPUB_Repub17cG0103300 [Reevesia pubescens]
MNIGNKVVDVSSFLIFEATGDSETGFFDPAMSVINHAENDNDDAESCSCDTTSDFLPGVREVNSSLEDKENDGDDDYEEDGEVVEQKEVHLYKKCRDDNRQRINGGGVAKENKKSSAVSVDSTLNEMEKNRLFWEACLAS